MIATVSQPVIPPIQGMADVPIGANYVDTHGASEVGIHRASSQLERMTITPQSNP